MTLHDWLEKTGTTQLEFSELSGVPQPLVSKYAAGKRRPHLEYAFAIEKATKGAVPAETWTKTAKKKRAA
jgi:transcriptional regulator with XRE-family HTH domain